MALGPRSDQNWIRWSSAFAADIVPIARPGCRPRVGGGQVGQPMTPAVQQPAPIAIAAVHVERSVCEGLGTACDEAHGLVVLAHVLQHLDDIVVRRHVKRDVMLPRLQRAVIILDVHGLLLEYRSVRQEQVLQPCRVAVPIKVQQPLVTSHRFGRLTWRLRERG